MKRKLRKIINGDSSLRMSLRARFGVTKQQFYDWEFERKPVPLKFFIGFKEIYEDIDEAHCPDYKRFLLINCKSASPSSDDSEGGDPEKQLIPDSKNNQYTSTNSRDYQANFVPINKDTHKTVRVGGTL